MRWLVIAALITCPAVARGNGRPPSTNGVHFQPGDDHSIYIATTFGLLISHDDGCSFRWICEQNLGYGGTFDPKYRIAPDGTIFATTFSGLRVSRDGGCSFTTATSDAPAGDPGRIADSWVDAIDIAPTGDVWVGTADNGKPNDVYRSTDNGRTFVPSGLSSPSIWWKSIAVAPSRPQRIYATGYQVAGAPDGSGQGAPAAHLQISDDAGAHWQESPLTGIRFGPMPQVTVLGVDPANADAVLLSSVLASGTGDRLYRSIDGGMTWTDVLDTASAIVDLAIEQTGSVLVATAGATAGAAAGAASFESADRGASFQPMAGSPALACVGQRGDGAVFGCGANWEPDFMAVARRTRGAWSKQFRFVDLAGPLDCPAGTGQRDVCAPQWPAVQAQFDAIGPTECAPRSAGCCDAGTAPGALGSALLAALCGGAVLRRRRGQSRGQRSNSRNLR